jgi:hypothetical protein
MMTLVDHGLTNVSMFDSVDSVISVNDANYKPGASQYVDYSDSEDEDNMIGLAEWVKSKKTVSCPFGKKEPEKFGFDITKAYKIFDLLLQQGQIKLSRFHTIPSAEELKRMKYCKWHNATSHDTNDCKIFRQQIQSAKQGRLKFETPTKAKKTMKIDQHRFPTNTVEVSSKETSRVNLLTSDSAQNKGIVDPKVQVTAADVKGKGLPLEEGESKPRRPVTYRMLINKFQR